MPALPGETFTKAVLNGTRHRWRTTYGMPVCDATKWSCLDTIIEAQALKACKDSDRSLICLQMLL